MLKGRVLPIVAIAIGLILIVVLCRLSGAWSGLVRTRQAGLPVDLQNVIPTGWVLLPNQPDVCDYDGDGADEWLILYRYDSTRVKAPYQAADQTVARGPIGGAIYDAQVNYVPQDPAIQSPYRPAFLIPYKLLPDFYTGKGQGYLGEGSVKVIKYTTSQDRNRCTAEEIYILGYEDGPLPTRLSVFRWQDESVGYAGLHFVGNARIAVDLGAGAGQPIQRVTTFNRLDNHRSLLCEVRQFSRQSSGANALDFAEESDAYTIDFCFNAPDDPEYPEGVVVALLRGNRPANPANMPGLIGKDYLLGGTSLPGEMGDPAQKPIRILSVTNQGTVAVHPEQGYLCPESQVGTAATKTPETTWWCGREQAEVITEIVLSGQTRRALWRLISVANEQVNTDIHWRVAAVALL